jgi:hypothetical protein
MHRIAAAETVALPEKGLACIFGDGRFVATDKTGNYGLGWLGVRFSF